MFELLQPILNGILLGGMYAVVAIGLSMIFGIMRLVNLAHGDLMILAAYLGLVCATHLGLPLSVALLVVGPTLFCCGYLLQRLLFNRVLRKGMEPSLITAFGLSVILQNTLLLLFTPDAQFLRTSLSELSVPIAGSVQLSAVYLVGFCGGGLVIALLHLLFRKTRFGIALRAASEDAQTAELMGIGTPQIFAYAMGVALVTAAVAGTLVGMAFTFYPHSGSQYLVIAFGVVVIGGMGSLIGTWIGGIVLGLAQLLGGHFFGPGVQLLFGYLVVLLVLVVRPEGILGKPRP